MEEPQEEKQLDLDEFVVGSLPTVIYIPNFISDSEQAELLHHINQVPALRWKSLKNRRLQNWGGVVHEKGLLPQELPPWLKKITCRICQQTGLFPSAINHVLINEYLPHQGIMPHQDGPAYFPVVAIISLMSPVVIEFTPHQRLRDPNLDEVIMKESEVNEKNDGQKNCSLLLMPCSMVIFKDQAYSDYLHGIQDSELHSLDKVVNIAKCPEFKQTNSSPEELELSGIEQNNVYKRTNTRVSLTCRLVLKVHKNIFKF
ncbi:oxidoreductase [Carex rostrata]